MTFSTFAFAIHVITPSCSASGWTRGMPPPKTALRAAPMPRVHVRATPQATISEPTPTVQPSPVAATTAAAAEEDETATVEAYLRPDAETNAHTQSVDALLSHLDTYDHAPGPRPRAKVLETSQSATLSVHAGDRVRSAKVNKAILDAIQVPIVQSATYTFRSTQDCIDYNLGRYDSYEYGRYGSPTARAAEEKIMALEGADDCLLSSSGMNAVTTLLLALVPENGHVVTTTDCYRRTRQFVSTVLPKMGISYTVLDPADVDGLRKLFQTREVSLYFSESPTNPLIRVVDVPTITAMCREHDVISVFDTTFATPLNFRPLAFGADLALHSATKYLSGHQDVMSGAVAGRQDLIDKVRSLHGVLGGVIDPHAAYLINRGMKTLAVRMEQHNRNATTLARFLSTHPKIARVHYPTLETHPDYEVACKLFEKGFGGVLSFEMRGDGDPWSVATFEMTGRFIDNLKLAYIGPSLGGCETIIEQVCIMGYFNQPLSVRRSLGVSNGLIRLSCGIEDTNDLVNDFEHALRHI